MDVNSEIKRLNALNTTGALTQDALDAARAAVLADVGADTAPVGPRADADDVEVVRLRRRLAEATNAGEVAQLDLAWERDRAAYEARNARLGWFHIGPILAVLPPRTAGRLHGVLLTGLGIVWVWATLTGQVDGEGFDLTRGYEHNAMVCQERPPKSPEQRSKMSPDQRAKCPLNNGLSWRDGGLLVGGG